MISIAVRWYLRYGLSYRDVEELPQLGKPGPSRSSLRLWMLTGGNRAAQRPPGAGRSTGCRYAVTGASTARSTWPPSPGSAPAEQGRGYYEKKLAEGKAGKEALRCLKRQVSDAIFARLRADARQATARANGPGGQQGNLAAGVTDAGAGHVLTTELSSAKIVAVQAISPRPGWPRW